jgi:hypothetical protein
MFKDKVKKKLEFAYDCAGATVDHVWENKTDYMLAYAIMLLVVMDYSINKRIDHLEGDLK